jgi:hypothetical protein
MDDSEEFQNIIVSLLTKEQFRKSSNNIKDEEARKVVVTDS